MTGIHPEMTFMQTELLKRRDTRLELAEKRRAYEMNGAAKRRRMAEVAVWETWKVRRLIYALGLDCTTEYAIRIGRKG